MAKANTKPKDDKDPIDDEEPEAVEAEVELSDEDDDDEKPAATPEETERQKKRRNRYKEAKEAAEAADKRADAAERLAAESDGRVRALELQHAELKGKVDAGGRDLNADAMAKLRHRRWTLNAQLATAETEGVAASVMQQIDELDEQIDEARNKRRQAMAPAPRQPTSEDYERTALQAEFPWLKSNPAAARYAKGRYDMLAAEKNSDGLGIAREAAQEAAAKFGLPGAQTAGRPTQADRQRAGAPRTGDLGGASGKPSTKVNTMKLNSAQVKMAYARFPDDDEEVAVKKFAEMLRRRGVA